METIIIDDELKSILVLEFHLQHHFDDFKITGKYTSAVEGLEAILKTNPQVLFLDINMPEMSGIDLLKKIQHLDVRVIFLTAHAEYAINAIKLDAFDYLLKPIDIDELVRVRSKIKDSLSTGEREGIAEKIKFRINNTLHIYEPNDIIYAESEGNYTTIYSLSKKPLVITKNLKKIREEYLKQPHFFKSHQSFLINLNHISYYSNYEITLINEVKVPLSRRRYKHFMDKV